VPLSDDEIDRIRRRPAYRCAVWVLRLIVLPWLGGMIVGVAGLLSGHTAGRVFFALWLAAAALTVAGAVLLRCAGVPFVRRSLAWGVEDTRTARMISDDVRWWRRR
jgi:hypothetical protein